MKTYIAFFLIFISSTPLFAQYPRVLSYTGVLADSVGRPISGTRIIEFSLITRQSVLHPSGWKHTEMFVLNGGMFSARLGDVSQGSTMPFPNLEGEYFLSIKVSGGSSGQPITLPPITLNASPYSLYSLEIADSTVSESKIISGSVNTEKIKDRNVTEPKLADGSVSSRAVQTDAISTNKMQNSSITEPKIADGAVNTRVIQSNSISEDKIQDGAITTNKLSSGAVSSINIQDGAIFSNHLSQGAVTEFALADNSVVNRHLQQGSVTSDKIEYRTIAGYNIQINDIGSNELSDYITLRQLTMSKNGDNSNITHAYLGDLYTASGANQGQYQGYGFAIFGKDGVSPGWNTNQSVCGFRTDGAVYGTSKPFVVPDPTDASRKIQYTAIEGPEAAMYYRGTGDLVNGKAIITLPPHFKAMAVDTGITVHLTPASASSFGLALTSVNSSKFTVQELQNGNGTYRFTFWVSAVRKGYENYKVYLYSNDFGTAVPPHKENPTFIKPTSNQGK